MRLMSALFAILLFTLSACKEDVEKYETIGKFTVEMDGKTVEFRSLLETDGKHTDIRQVGSMRVLLLSGTSNTDKDAKPTLPRISVMLQKTTLGSKPFALGEIIIYDQSYTKFLMASGTRFGSSELSDLKVSDAGEISFSFTADLVRVEKTGGEKKLIEGNPGVHIEGSFSGTIPARELEK